MEPTSEEEALLLGKDVKLSKVPSSSPELPKVVEPVEWATTPKTSPPSATPQPGHYSRKSKETLKTDPKIPGK